MYVYVILIHGTLYIVYNVQFIVSVYSISIIYNVCKLYTVQCTVISVHCTVYIDQCTMHTV